MVNNTTNDEHPLFKNSGYTKESDMVELGELIYKNVFTEVPFHEDLVLFQQK